MLIVKEIFGPTIQGEGQTAGQPAIFVRFAGCNMWSGNPETKAESKCPYCDTDFWKGERMTVEKVIDKVTAIASHNNIIVVLTGGEPLLQDELYLIALLNQLHIRGFTVQIETNGTINKPLLLGCIDYVTCSPKVAPRDCTIDWKYVNSIKLLYPHPDPNITAETMDKELDEVNIFISHKYLQPIATDSHELNSFNLNATIQKVKELGLPWTLSLQTHKIIGQP